MIELRSYRKPEVPREIAIQIASYVRIQWPSLLGTKTPLWEATPYPVDGLHFVMTDDDVLISHALVTLRALEYQQSRLNVMGLSSVFCYPTHRGHGFGERVVASATAYIRERADVDFGLLFCGERVKSLYLRQGWIEPPGMRVTFGDDHRLYSGGVILMLRLSENLPRVKFDNPPLHVGAATW